MVTTTTYDPDSRPLQVQQSANGSFLRATSTTYTPSGKTATATDANGNVTRYAYDLLDRLATTVDAQGRTAQFTYTTLSQPYRTFNPGISTTNALLTQTYTADGQRASLADANGNTTAFAYDGFDRLATTTYPGSTTETFTYDADSNVLTRKTRAGGTPIAFTYDTLNRLATKTPPTGPVVTYGYDLAGRLTRASDNSSVIPSAVSPTGTPVAYTTNFAYDALNRPTGTTWDSVNTATAPGAASSVVFAHNYNKVNQRTGQSISDNTWINYPAAAASTVSYTANNLNQYTAVGAATPTYDTNGNLTSDGTYTLGYDAENRLVSASGAGNTAAYTFDAQGRRKTRTVNGSTTVSVTDADNREVLEYNGASGALLRWYAYGLGPNAVLGQMNVPANTRTTPVPDLLGSVVGSMDAGTGTLTKFAYRPYGATAAAPTPFGFTGQRFDQESGSTTTVRGLIRHIGDGSCKPTQWVTRLAPISTLTWATTRSMRLIQADLIPTFQASRAQSLESLEVLLAAECISRLPTNMDYPMSASTVRRDRRSDIMPVSAYREAFNMVTFRNFKVETSSSKRV